MGKKTGTSQDLDNLSMLNLGDEGEDTEMEIDETNAGGTLDGVELPGEDDTTSEETTTTELPEGGEEEVATEDAGTAPVEEGDENAVDDFDAMIQDLLKSGEELEDKVQEVVDASEEGENPELTALISELQTMIAEKNASLEESMKERDVWKSKYMERYSDDADMSVYKPEIETIENNPKLRNLLKYRNNTNEKVSEKVTNLLSDLFYERTGQDISELLEEKDRAAAASTLNVATSDTQLAPEAPVIEDEEISAEDSMNSLLGV